MECELCGSESRNSVEILFEGKRIIACLDCSSMGTMIEARKPVKPQLAKTTELEEFNLVEGYGTLLRKAREKKGLTIEDQAKQLFERASTIQHVEHEKLLPDLKLARKLEKFFKTELIKEKEEEKAE